MTILTVIEDRHRHESNTVNSMMSYMTHHDLTNRRCFASISSGSYFLPSIVVQHTEATIEIAVAVFLHIHKIAKTNCVFAC